MNETPINPSQMPAAPLESAPETVKFLQKVKLMAKENFLKFYSNKKIFLPVTIAFGLIILTLFVGLIFGNKSQPAQKNQSKSSPTPVASQTPPATGSADFLTTTGNALFDLNNQINNLDVKQGKLQAPQLNFDISF